MGELNTDPITNKLIILQFLYKTGWVKAVEIYLEMSVIADAVNDN